MHEEVIAEILQEVLPPRRLRQYPRVVKRKMSNFLLKRAKHQHWPQPTKTVHHAVQIR